MRERGKTLFVSSHLAEVFDGTADRLLIIEEGRIVRSESAPFPGNIVDLYLEALESPPKPRA